MGVGKGCPDSDDGTHHYVLQGYSHLDDGRQLAIMLCSCGQEAKFEKGASW